MDCCYCYTSFVGVVEEDILELVVVASWEVPNSRWRGLLVEDASLSKMDFCAFSTEIFMTRTCENCSFSKLISCRRNTHKLNTYRRFMVNWDNERLWRTAVGSGGHGHFCRRRQSNLDCQSASSRNGTKEFVHLSNQNGDIIVSNGSLVVVRTIFPFSKGKITKPKRSLTTKRQ